MLTPQRVAEILCNHHGGADCCVWYQSNSCGGEVRAQGGCGVSYVNRKDFDKSRLVPQGQYDTRYNQLTQDDYILLGVPNRQGDLFRKIVVGKKNGKMYVLLQQGSKTILSTGETIPDGWITVPIDKVEAIKTGGTTYTN